MADDTPEVTEDELARLLSHDLLPLTIQGASYEPAPPAPWQTPWSSAHIAAVNAAMEASAPAAQLLRESGNRQAAQQRGPDGALVPTVRQSVAALEEAVNKAFRRDALIKDVYSGMNRLASALDSTAANVLSGMDDSRKRARIELQQLLKVADKQLDASVAVREATFVKHAVSELNYGIDKKINMLLQTNADKQLAVEKAKLEAELANTQYWREKEAARDKLYMLIALVLNFFLGVGLEYALHSDAAQWAATSYGRAAHAMYQSGELQQILSCDRKGLYNIDGRCTPASNIPGWPIVPKP